MQVKALKHSTLIHMKMARYAPRQSNAHGAYISSAKNHLTHGLGYRVV